MRESAGSEAVINIDPDMKLQAGMSLWLVLDKNKMDMLM